MMDRRARLGHELMTAILDYSDEKVGKLLLEDFDSNVIDGEGTTLLHAACWRMSPFDEVYLDILKLNPDLNAKDAHGQTPLMYSVYSCPSYFNRHLALLEAGADINIMDDQGKTVIERAAQKGNNQDVSDFLLRWPEDESLRQAIENGDESATKWLDF